MTVDELFVREHDPRDSKDGVVFVQAPLLHFMRASEAANAGKADAAAHELAFNMSPLNPADFGGTNVLAGPALMKDREHKALALANLKERQERLQVEKEERKALERASKEAYDHRKKLGMMSKAQQQVGLGNTQTGRQADRKTNKQTNK